MVTFINEDGRAPRPVAKTAARHTSSAYTPRHCPGCGSTIIPHATTGEQCPGRPEVKKGLTAHERLVASVASASVHSRERLEYLATLVGPVAAVELHDRAQQVYAEEQRRRAVQ